MTSTCHENIWQQYKYNRHQHILTHHRKDATTNQAIRIVASPLPRKISISISTSNNRGQVRMGVDHPMKVLLPKTFKLTVSRKWYLGITNPMGSKVFEMSLSICLLVKTFASQFCVSMWETLKTKRSSLCCQTIPSVFIVWSWSKNSKLSFASRYSSGRFKRMLDSFESTCGDRIFLV